MAKVKTVVTTSGETAIQLDDHYSYAWIRNIGSGDCYVSVSPDIVAGADDVLSLKAGSIVRLTTKADVVYVKGATTVEVYAQNFSDCPFEKFGGEAGEIVIEPLSVTENGTYTAPTGTDGYSPVSVAVPQTTVQSLSVTQNGTYTAPSGTAYSPVTVDVQEQPWQPLQDGYSNFWFELTDDTLSPWLNFSAKNNDAVIDWGDGSGEQALDTLTPIHTYAKAGKYVVKVKGVTGIAQRLTTTDNTYIYALKAIELNSEVVSLANSAFQRETGLEHADVYNALYSMNDFTYSGLRDIKYHTPLSIVAGFYMCFALKEYDCTGATEIAAGGLQYCMALNKIILPPTVQSLGNSALGQCVRLTEVHVQATTPPTLGTNVFVNLPSNWICYVPTGTGETYKAAAGWSAYSDHILEEGQTPNRTMMSRLAKTDMEAEKADEESR